MTGETDTSILIIDDAPESLSALKKLLLPKYRVLPATPGVDGLRVTGNLPNPHLIMADMVGFATLAQLYDNPVAQDIPIIFLTALANICDAVVRAVARELMQFIEAGDSHDDPQER